MSELITIELNRVAYRVTSSLNIFDFFEQHHIDTQGCALAIDNQIVPRTQWQQQGLSDGDALSLFQAIAGG